MSEPVRTWIVLRSRQNMETHVDRFLNARGVETYLPIVHRYIVRRKRKEPTPFFPSYLFARVDLYSNDYVTLKWTPGLGNIVRFDGRPASVPEAVVAEIRERLSRLDKSGYFEGTAPYQHGDLIRIKSGPLKGLEAIFDRGLSQRGRVKIFLEMLGRLTACEVDLECIEKAG